MALPTYVCLNPLTCAGQSNGDDMCTNCMKNQLNLINAQREVQGLRRLKTYKKYLEDPADDSKPASKASKKYKYESFLSVENPRGVDYACDLKVLVKWKVGPNYKGDQFTKEPMVALVEDGQEVDVRNCIVRNLSEQQRQRLERLLKAENSKASRMLVDLFRPFPREVPYDPFSTEDDSVAASLSPPKEASKTSPPKRPASSMDVVPETPPESPAKRQNTNAPPGSPLVRRNTEVPKRTLSFPGGRVVPSAARVARDKPVDPRKTRPVINDGNKSDYSDDSDGEDSAEFAQQSRNTALFAESIRRFLSAPSAATKTSSAGGVRKTTAPISKSFSSSTRVAPAPSSKSFSSSSRAAPAPSSKSFSSSTHAAPVQFSNTFSSSSYQTPPNNGTRKPVRREVSPQLGYASLAQDSQRMRNKVLQVPSTFRRGQTQFDVSSDSGASSLTDYNQPNPASDPVYSGSRVTAETYLAQPFYSFDAMVETTADKDQLLEQRKGLRVMESLRNSEKVTPLVRSALDMAIQRLKLRTEEGMVNMQKALQRFMANHCITPEEKAALKSAMDVIKACKPLRAGSQ